MAYHSLHQCHTLHVIFHCQTLENFTATPICYQILIPHESVKHIDWKRFSFCICTKVLYIPQISYSWMLTSNVFYIYVFFCGTLYTSHTLHLYYSFVLDCGMFSIICSAVLRPMTNKMQIFVDATLLNQPWCQNFVPTKTAKLFFTITVAQRTTFVLFSHGSFWSRFFANAFDAKSSTGPTTRRISSV